MSDVDIATLTDVLSLLRRAEKDWNYLDSEERLGTVHEARYELEEAMGVKHE